MAIIEKALLYGVGGFGAVKAINHLVHRGLVQQRG